MNEEKSTKTKVEVSSSSNVIVFPDFEKLKSEVEKKAYRTINAFVRA